MRGQEEAAVVSLPKAVGRSDSLLRGCVLDTLSFFPGTLFHCPGIRSYFLDTHTCFLNTLMCGQEEAASAPAPKAVEHQLNLIRRYSRIKSTGLWVN